MGKFGFNKWSNMSYKSVCASIYAFFSYFFRPIEEARELDTPGVRIVLPDLRDKWRVGV